MTSLYPSVSASQQIKEHLNRSAASASAADGALQMPALVDDADDADDAGNGKEADDEAEDGEEGEADDGEDVEADEDAQDGEADADDGDENGRHISNVFRHELRPDQVVSLYISGEQVGSDTLYSTGSVAGGYSERYSQVDRQVDGWRNLDRTLDFVSCHKFQFELRFRDKDYPYADCYPSDCPRELGPPKTLGDIPTEDGRCVFWDSATLEPIASQAEQPVRYPRSPMTPVPVRGSLRGGETSTMKTMMLS